MKSLTATLALSFITLTGFAQISFQTNNQQIIEDAVAGGLLIVRQEYQLEDTVSMKRYTWNNRPEFGSTLSFCVLAENGYVISNSGLKPWMHDPKFDKYKDSAYRPVLTDTWYKSAASRDFRKADCVATDDTVHLSDSSLVYVKDTLFGQGFAIDTMPGTKDGWIVWLTSKDEESIGSDSLMLITYRHKLTVLADRDIYEIPAPTSSRYVIGGVYVEPGYTGIGKIEFRLAGIIVKNGEKWQMCKICRTKKAGNESTLSEDTGTLTPAASETHGMEETKEQGHEKD